jgi:hypothetical protein
MVVACALTSVACGVSAGGAARRNDTDGARTQTVRHNEVLLLPPVTGGLGGWCMTIVSGECPTADSRPFHDPVVAESWGEQGPPAVRRGVILTTSGVAAVSIGGRAVVATNTESVLPDHLRAAVVEVGGGPVRKIYGFTVSSSSLHFTPLSANDSPLPRSAEPRPALEFEVPNRSWERPSSAPRSICSLSESSALAGLVVQGGSVMTKVSPHKARLGRELVSCISTSYLLNNWPIVAAVLVDAARPGIAPGALPAMQPVATHPGIFQGPGVAGQTIARRIARAWLVVGGGKGLQQRLSLLEHLRANVDI